MQRWKENSNSGMEVHKKAGELFQHHEFEQWLDCEGLILTFGTAGSSHSSLFQALIL